MRKEISFIHAADLHLDTPFKGLANIPEQIFDDIRKSTFRALDRLVSVAIQKRVDFVLIVGDLFDHENQSLQAQIHLREAFEKLKRHHISVYMSYGNHDHLNGNIFPMTYPENVHVFPDETVRQFNYEKNGHPLATIYGFSYENASVQQNKVAEYDVKDEHVPFHIATLHGSLATNTDHDTYAPFQLSELTKEPFDYWALGHIHEREVLKKDPFVVYPGNTQGRHRKECGEKGCYYVTMTEASTDVSFIPTQAIEFKSLTVDLSTCSHIHQLERLLTHTLQEEMKPNLPQLIHVTFHGENEQAIAWQENHFVEDLIEFINESFLHQKNWLYIYDYTVDIQSASTAFPFFEGDYFTGELTKMFQKASIQPYVKELFQHRQARKYLLPLSEEEEQKVKKEAYQRLLYHLLKE
ncbi:MAG TPA: DNA repair exonuclease [Bacillota bacterium]